MNKYFRILFLLSIFIHAQNLFGQQDRFSLLSEQLTALAQQVPALNQKVETTISNTTLHDFLAGIASTHGLNFIVDPGLTQRITLYLTNEPVKNVLLYTARQYNLDFSITGSIISIRLYRNPLADLPPPAKELKISFNTSDSLLTMDLQGDSLQSVAKFITRLTNRNIVVMPELASKKVSGYVQNMPVKNALEKIALTNNFKINRTNDNAFVLEPLAANEQIVTRQNTLPDPTFQVRSINSLNPGASSAIAVDSDQQGNKLINLNVVNMPLREVIKNISEQAEINYFIYSELAGFTTANVRDMPFDQVLQLILQGSDYTFSKQNNVYLVGKRQDEGLRTHKVISLKFRSVDSLLAVIPQEIKRGVDIKEFTELNSFLLSGSQPQINEIEAFVRALDQTVPMVMIEVIMMDVQKRKTVQTGLKLGIDTGASPMARGGNLFGAGTDFTFSSGDINRFIDFIGLNNVFNIGKVTPRFYASLKLLEENSNVDLRQTPKLSTLNGHKADLSIGSRRYYRIVTQNYIGSLDPRLSTTEDYKPVEANLAISITPFVSGDENVTLDIGIEISDFIGPFQLNQPPPTASSKFKSAIRVKNEEMIVLGGIERTEKSESGSGTPFLSRIPVLKWIFSNRSRTTGKTVSVVFIKPTIIY